MSDSRRQVGVEQDLQPSLGAPMSRRDFLKLSGIAVAAIVLSGGLGGVLAACADSGGPGLMPGSPPLPQGGSSGSSESSESSEPPP